LEFWFPAKPQKPATKGEKKVPKWPQGCWKGGNKKKKKIRVMCGRGESPKKKSLCRPEPKKTTSVRTKGDKKSPPKANQQIGPFRQEKFSSAINRDRKNRGVAIREGMLGATKRGGKVVPPSTKWPVCGTKAKRSLYHIFVKRERLIPTGAGQIPPSLLWDPEKRGGIMGFPRGNVNRGLNPKVVKKSKKKPFGAG